MADERGMLPVETKTGIQLISVNLLLDDETDPVIWRGPVIGGVVTQFWTDVIWDVDYLFVHVFLLSRRGAPLLLFQGLFQGLSQQSCHLTGSRYGIKHDGLRFQKIIFSGSQYIRQAPRYP